MAGNSITEPPTLIIEHEMFEVYNNTSVGVMFNDPNEEINPWPSQSTRRIYFTGNTQTNELGTFINSTTLTGSIRS